MNAEPAACSLPCLQEACVDADASDAVRAPLSTRWNHSYCAKVWCVKVVVSAVLLSTHKMHLNTYLHIHTHTHTYLHTYIYIYIVQILRILQNFLHFVLAAAVSGR